ncbi:hypothetical protein FY557_17450 [Chryseobacterium sp. SN22]|uniref:hypothetical protein n=1 Tax=Chryseobacterium sp. SN22 TaxID=2606431 RepID=UPI0011EC2A64|nr:hypothetical protein [Chryseobacterium sp. SN22]KAA0126436.1 hypothetical protein FY557_17450 [Chryseobacterium sp. SN22]
MNKYNEGAKLIEGRMTFVQEFLQKKYGFGILFFFLLTGAGLGFWWFNEQGKKEGAKSSQIEIAARKAIRKNDSLTIEKLRSDITEKEVELVTCRSELEKKQDFSQLKKSLQQKIEEADEINRMFRRETIPQTKKLNKNLKQIVNQ